MQKSLAKFLTHQKPTQCTSCMSKIYSFFPHSQLTVNLCLVKYWAGPQPVSTLMRNTKHSRLEVQILFKDLINVMVFGGQIPESACHIFYGAQLIALSKGDSTTDVRPIAIGLTLRRLAAKVAMAKLRNTCETLLKYSCK